MPALLDHAQHTDVVIAEDDYDGEFRFGGQPLDSLQTLDDAESLCYAGSLSKSLVPAPRLSYLIAPVWAPAALAAAKRVTDWRNPLLPQETLASFVAEEHLAPHVRKTRVVFGAAGDFTTRDPLIRFGFSRAYFPEIRGLHLAA